ncbi:MAG: phosphopantothenoylcysteine decarboxylase [Planctomycetes bacterium]|nr:phosphopantothenoylcysteine decarboxylase [Planctomycetota bacterium]
MSSEKASAKPSAKPRVLLAICGSIAAYKGADLCSKLVQAGYDVTVCMTDAAQKLVGPLTFAALTGHPVATDPYTSEHDVRVEHIHLADLAQVMVIAPATANFLGKAANGIADDVVLSTLLAVTCPVIVAPAMNVRMWNHPAVARNLATVRGFGYEIVEPGDGFLACGDVGRGRMAEPSQIVARVAAALGR